MKNSDNGEWSRPTTGNGVGGEETMEDEWAVLIWAGKRFSGPKKTEYKGCRPHETTSFCDGMTPDSARDK